MPIETCAYCGKIASCDLWHGACWQCDGNVVQAAMERGERFVAKPGSLRSYPESWLREQDLLVGEPDKRLVVR